MIILPLSPRMPRHIRDLLTVQSANIKSFLLTNEPKYSENGGNGETLCKFYSITRVLLYFFGGHPDPEIRGEPGLKKKFFRPFGAHFNLKIIKRGRAPQSPPLDPPLQHTFVNVVILVFYYRFARILCDLMAYLKLLSPAT